MMNYFFIRRRLITLAMLFSLSALLPAGQAIAQNMQEPAPEGSVPVDRADPWENWNRKVYTFNETIDRWFLKPVAQAYRDFTPQIVDRGITNFFNNLTELRNFTNSVLQLKGESAVVAVGRFTYNTTFGLGGLIDVATAFDLPERPEDFGQTLAVWGVPAGPYLVLPFLGPTTFRGVPGTAVDMATNPVNYTGIPLGLPVQALSVVNTRANAEGALRFIDEAALDPYIFTRESYLQWRNHLATDGADDASYDVTADFEDELFDDEEENLSESVEENEKQSDSFSGANMEMETDEQIKLESITGEDDQGESVPLLQNDHL